MSGLSPNRLRPFQPTPFGEYMLLSPLAVGGMGELFLARKQGSATPCVIKKILPHLASGPDLLQRFVHEARAMAELSHESIARVQDMGILDGRPFLVMEYVDGKDLRKVAARCRERNEPMPLPVTLYIMSRVLEALAYAHDSRDQDGNEIHLVHRDVSPPNILISYTGEVKVIDFGLAKSTLHNTQTHPSLLVGKFLYMSPEQARHQPVDRRSDLYSVGVCLYELLLGSNPLEGLSAGEMLAQVSEPRFLATHPLPATLPPQLVETVRRALAVDPRARFQTAGQMRDELNASLQTLEGGSPEELSRYMRQVFAAEYAAERRLVWNANRAMLPVGERPTGMMPATRLTPQALSETRTPLEVPGVRVAALQPVGSIPPPDPLSNEDTPLHRAFPDPGRDPSNEETAQALRPPAQSRVRSLEVPAVTPDARTDEVPQLGPRGPITENDQTDLPFVLRAPPVYVGPPPSRKRSALWPGLGLLLVVGLGAGAWGLYRSLSANRNGEPEPDVDDVAPLGSHPGVEGTTQLSAAWRNISIHFQTYRHQQGCSRPEQAEICRRFGELERDVMVKLSSGEDDPELLGRVRALNREMSDELGGG